MDNPIEVGPQRYRSDPTYPYAVDPVLRFDQRRLASMVGYVAIGLPLVLAAGGLAWARLGLGTFPTSISAFYYESILLGDVFVGALAFIGTLMLAYRGWNRKVADLATAAGIAAYFVALFPIGGWMREGQAEPAFALAALIVHFSGAAALFLILAFFCLFVFTRVEPHQALGDPVALSAKRKRDAIYKAAGWIILASIGAIGIDAVIGLPLPRATFWAETVALLAFGVSWIVQGRASGHLLLDERDRHDKAIARAEQAQAERLE